MASAAYPLANATINWLRGDPDTPPDSLVLRLWAVPPLRDGTGGTEVTGGGYVPAAMELTEPTVGETAMVDVAVFTDWPSGQVATHYSINDADDDRFFIIEEFLTAQTTAAGGTVRIAAADMQGRAA